MLLVVVAGGCAAAGAAPDFVPTRTPHRKDRYQPPQPPTRQLAHDERNKLTMAGGVRRRWEAWCVSSGGPTQAAAAAPKEAQAEPGQARRQETGRRQAQAKEEARAGKEEEELGR